MLFMKTPCIEDTEERERQARNRAADDRQDRDGPGQLRVLDTVHAWGVAREVHSADRGNEEESCGQTSDNEDGFEAEGADV